MVSVSSFFILSLSLCCRSLDFFLFFIFSFFSVFSVPSFPSRVGDGLSFFFSPQWGLLVEPRTWAVAGSQIFFSLGIAWGSLVNYSSFNPIKNEISKDAFLMTGLSALTAFLVGLAVFSIIGHMALVSHQPVEEVRKAEEERERRSVPGRRQSLACPSSSSLFSPTEKEEKKRYVAQGRGIDRAR